MNMMCWLFVINIICLCEIIMREYIFLVFFNDKFRNIENKNKILDIV